MGHHACPAEEEYTSQDRDAEGETGVSGECDTVQPVDVMMEHDGALAETK